ncbi:flagellar biosynthetic protein FliQ [Paramagnetospirillum kuznetsovii]|uniref:Flagellar biosynthetic protein FliQ n=1 Tax=Paramagnetospirillum kuznetsovii TaxID=2053833 RepID=A0A364NTE4_9PROT|nr:flagellar biosynthesis protein FliQ [Paramagnetospirillum kuznetsovii]RAU20185.1 flagellar biosynthetic protein FliQ [Paramagnetospirillum kuznetsovii]
MTEAELLDLARVSIMTMIKVAAPMLLVGMAVGILVSIFQTLTQLQEQTLTFVPKMMLGFGSIIIFMPYMLQTMTDFWKMILDRIIAGGPG